MGTVLSILSLPHPRLHTAAFIPRGPPWLSYYIQLPREGPHLSLAGQIAICAVFAWPAFSCLYLACCHTAPTRQDRSSDPRPPIPRHGRFLQGLGRLLGGHDDPEPPQSFEAVPAGGRGSTPVVVFATVSSPAACGNRTLPGPPLGRSPRFMADRRAAMEVDMVALLAPGPAT